MEDCFDAVLNFRDRPDEAFFAIYDGHSGPNAAKFASKNIARSIAGQESLDSNTSSSIKNAFLAVDHEFLTIVSEKYERTKRLMADGTTVTAILLKGDTLYCCNLGDSECVMSKAGRPVVCSKIHTPASPKEKARAEANGVMIKLNRLAGTLGVPRGIGDAEFKDLEKKGPAASTAKPSIKEFELDSNVEFVILACDGLWDVMRPEQATKFVSRRLKENLPLKEVTEQLVNHSIDLGSMDNVSAIVVLFEHNADFVEKPEEEPTFSPEMLNDQLPISNSFRA
jgi:serine/threonine protein phosphatase PrpC